MSADTWRADVAAAIADGYTTFITLTGVDDDGLQVWLRLRNAAGHDCVLRTSGDHVQSIVELFPIAAWYEREVAEMFGVQFIGHTTTPLLLSVESPQSPLRKANLLEARNSSAWPGGKEPGETGDRPPSRRRLLPPGVMA